MTGPPEVSRGEPFLFSGILYCPPNTSHPRMAVCTGLRNVPALLGKFSRRGTDRFFIPSTVLLDMAMPRLSTGRCAVENFTLFPLSLWIPTPNYGFHALHDPFLLSVFSGRGRHQSPLARSEYRGRPDAGCAS